MKEGIVIGIGELLFDMFPTGKKLGGAPVNFAYHVAQQGVRSLAISAIGNDALGDEIVSIMDQKKIEGFVPRVDAPTGTVKVDLDAAGVPNFTITRDVAWDKIPSDPFLKEAAKDCVAVCFGSLAQRDEVSRAAINMLVDAIPAENSPLVIFDINLRQKFYSKELIEASLEKSNILKINDDEYRIVAEMFGLDSGDFESGSRKLIADYSLQMLILTCGEKGSYIFWEGGSSFEATPKVKVVDTVGAGDSFTAAFCASILKGMSIQESHKKAVEVSAYVCTQSGAMPDMNCVTKLA